MLKFVGKTAIVTGAGNGLGRAYAIDLARRGVSVIVNDLNGDAAAKVVAEIRKHGGHACVNDMSVLDGESIVESTLKEFGSCDIIVSNAGTLQDKSFHKMSKAQFREIVDIHLHGTFEMCHAAWPHMQEKNFGRIVNVSSSSGLYGNFGQANYSAAKMAIIGLTNTLAKEGSKHNINVNCIAPIAASKMTENLLPPALLDMLRPEHVSSLVSYLSHESCTTNGQIFEAGGGWFAGVRWQRSSGVALGNNDSPPTAELVRDHFDKIVDYSVGAKYPTDNVDGFKDIMQAVSTFDGNVAATSATDSSPTSPTSPLASKQEATESAELSDAATESEKVFREMLDFLEKNPTKAQELVESLNASFQFDITHDGTTKQWILDMKLNSATKTFSERLRQKVEGDGRCDAMLLCSDDVFVSLIEEKLSPEMAYMRNLLRVRGNVATALKLKPVFSLYNSRHK